MTPPKKRASSRKKGVAETPANATIPETVVESPQQETFPDQVIATPVGEVPTAHSAAALVVKNPGRLLLVVLVLGWAFDFLFWKQRVGVNFPIFLAVCVLGGVYLLWTEGYRAARRAFWLLLPFLVFVAFTFLRREPLTVFLAYVFSLFSIGLFATSYQGGRWYLYRLSDYLYKFIRLIGDVFGGFAVYFLRFRKAPPELVDEKKRLPLAGLVRGFVIAVPILLCFGSLLASADVVFNQKLADFFDAEKISEYSQRLFRIVLLAYLVGGVFLHSASKSLDERITEEKKSLVKPFLGFTESAVVLGSVSALFFIFVLVQFRYFFGGETNIGVAGYTYSQYARRGFNELVLVAFFSLVLLVVLSIVTARQNAEQRRTYSILSVAVVALVMVILVSAYQRISLAIGWHGYSRLRLYPRIFLIWLGLLLIAVAVLEIFQRERYFALAAVVAAMGFAVSITLFNVDASIVKLNVYRSWHGKNLNVPHLASLSADAVPPLAQQFLSKELPTSTHEGLGAILACYKYSEDAPHTSQYDWRSFNTSSWQAHLALEAIRPGLKGYTIQYKKFPVRVKTPNGVLYNCWEYDSANDRDNGSD